jgi:endonuclease/exonuclease/phosphatase family metal-dependent hydrolase
LSSLGAWRTVDRQRVMSCWPASHTDDRTTLTISPASRASATPGTAAPTPAAADHPTPSPSAGPAPTPPVTESVQQARDGTQVKVLTINVKAFQLSDGGNADPRAFDAIERYIERVDPDIVMFQELDNGTERSGKVNQLAEIARRTDATDSQFAKALDFQGGEYGIGIMTRHGFSIRDRAGGGNDTRRVELPKGTGDDADHEQRVALVAPIVGPGGAELTAVTTHLANKGPGRGAQLDRLNDIIEDVAGGAGNDDAGLQDDLSTRLVLGGDFNTRRGPAEEHLGDKVQHIGERDPDLGDTGIDQMYVSSNVDVRDSHLDPAEKVQDRRWPWQKDVYSTDHPAVQATLVLR